MVEYQQALQTVSDPLLGWTTIEGLEYYVRLYRNMKGSIPLNAIDAATLSDYAGVVGHLLCKGHARTGRASTIAGYIGSSDKLDQALSRFARAYADQTEADHQLFVSPYFTWRASKRWGITAYALAGLTRSSPKGGGGVQFPLYP